MKYIILFVSIVCLSFTFYRNVNNEETSVRDTRQKAVSLAAPLNVYSTNEASSVSNVVSAAQAFYNSLSSGQQTSLQLSYTNSLARKWSNLPCGTGCRNGIQLGTNLSSAQFSAAMQVVKEALSADSNDGYDEFHQMNLAEAYLHANGGGSGYDSTLRWMAFLNTPSNTGAWMLQFGGHHYAANIAFNNGHVIGATPFFMGLEPKTFSYNSVAYDPLGGERTALSNALASMSSAELTTAYISSAFSDCVMLPGETNGGPSAFPSATIGKPLSSLTSTQQNLILSVMQLYVGDMDATTASAVMTGYTSELSQTYISYHGSGTSGNASSFLTAQGDYARIAGPNVWIEFSCQGGVVIQNQIHYHTVWRDRSHDYGVDLSGAAIDEASTTTTGVSENKAGSKISIYPNPAGEQITLVLNSQLNNAKVIITDLTGKVVLSGSNLSGEKIQLNTGSLEKGIYTLQVLNNGVIITGKFTKQ